MKEIGILGSTGSIGLNTLNVINNLSDFKIKYLSANKNIDLLIEQANKFQPEIICIGDDNLYKKLKTNLSNKFEILCGRDALLYIAGIENIDICVNAIVGGPGMEPTIKALEAGVDVALSNKESMVMAGGIINDICKKTGAKIFPVDSEHSAIWQCLIGEKIKNVKRLILTASGGPFREKSLSDFNSITVDEALNHPTWKMGKKITIDSATMMNKGFEVIEAFWLFKIDYDKIEIVIHPQSIIHSMVEFIDGSIKSQMGRPTMKIPIQFALTYPDRLNSSMGIVNDFSKMENLTFELPDLNKYPSIDLAYNALKKGGTSCASINLSNDITVDLFLKNKISFNEIYQLNNEVYKSHNWKKNPSVSDLYDLEVWINDFLKSLIK
mgnify:FL=1|tara:strand:- start:5990 stop:7135 length:1146 start_codon:yes stop_codon:yes gene_type:complete